MQLDDARRRWNSSVRKVIVRNYVQFILNALEAILKEGQTSLKYVRLLMKKINVHLQEKYPNYIFYVGLNPPSHPYFPVGIAVSPAKFVEYLDDYLAAQKRCKWCNGILD